MGDFLMPSLGADMEAGTLVKWRVAEGDTVARGDIVAEVDTDKGVIEIECFEPGVVTALIAQPGEKLPVGTVMAVIRGAGEPAAAVTGARGETAAAVSPASAATPTPRPGCADTPPPAAAGTVEVAAAGRPVPGEPRRARRRAEELGVDLAAVPGTARAAPSRWRTSSVPPQRTGPHPPAPNRTHPHLLRCAAPLPRPWRGRSARSRTTTSRRAST